MPDLEPTQESQLAERRGSMAHVLLWVTAKDRTTGDPASLGFWTGDDHADISIGGVSRTYYGAGAVIDVAPVRAGIGVRVRYHTITLPPMLDEVKQALRGYEPRLAKVEVHVAPIDLDTGGLLGAPIRMIKGTLNEAPEEIGPKGGDGQVRLRIASTARRLTFGLPLLRSNEELKRRDTADLGREYSDVAGDWVVPWGQA